MWDACGGTWDVFSSTIVQSDPRFSAMRVRSTLASIVCGHSAVVLALIHPANIASNQGGLVRMSMSRSIHTDEYLIRRINEYMTLRNTTSTDPVNVNAKESFFSFLKPSGWYKDKTEIDFKKRVDSRIPKGTQCI
jgi:hypothetical protein